ncbi:MAG TPA: hypothetical protein PLD35_02725, partial [Caldisericia bacterium]|nr:hypothetical protein [Caldisericia bacterium]
ESRKYLLLLLKGRKEVNTGSPINLGMTSYSILDKNFEDDSGCAFEDDSYYGLLFGLVKIKKKK